MFKGDALKDLTTPTSAFIIFEEEEGAQWALKAKGNRELMGQPFKFEKASQPTDIIWENRHLQWWERGLREVFAYGIVLAILVSSFVAILYLAHLEIVYQRVFPAVDCDLIQQQYG